MSEPLEVMEHLVTLTYREELPPNTVRFGEALIDGRILGQKCPICGRVYLPPKDFCPLDVIVLGPENDVEVADHGVVTGFTIVTPVRYYGQTKTEPFVFASILLDGTSTVLRGQDVTGIPIEQIHAGLRVAAVWLPAEERNLDGLSARGGTSFDGCITSFAATGEPDASEDTYRGFEF
jgi:hypothetical protein